MLQNMYVPKEFEFADQTEMIAFMKRYNFGVLVSQQNGVPLATHLPFHVMERDGQVFLTAHFAKANTQWKDIEEQQVLVIFSQPHAYISPVHYNKEQNVPTWNYVAVHAYGKCRRIQEMDKGMEILEQMIDQSEPGYRAQWERLDTLYKSKLYSEIVPFELEITDLKAAAKLSQNKTEGEQRRIINELEESVDSNEQDVAGYMKRFSLPPGHRPDAEEWA
jgi:transcriptional regulator